MQHDVDLKRWSNILPGPTPIQAEVVKLRYFAGMTNEKTAQALEVSVATVKNYWTFARTWIFTQINNS